MTHFKWSCSFFNICHPSIGALLHVQPNRTCHSLQLENFFVGNHFSSQKLFSYVKKSFEIFMNSNWLSRKFLPFSRCRHLQRESGVVHELLQLGESKRPISSLCANYSVFVLMSNCSGARLTAGCCLTLSSNCLQPIWPTFAVCLKRK